MKITTELVDYISELSRLELEAGEKRDMTAGLERIVAYMDVLNRLDTTGVEPMSHVFPVKNVFREDEVEPSQSRDELLAGSPAPDKEAFLVPKAVE
jgi:aspartyl-tRNA(Asn)/glutamyl-tRNA(Gln) amidotransferase subunit C